MLQPFLKPLPPRRRITASMSITAIDRLFKKFVPGLFSYRKGLCGADALLTIFHHLQKVLDVGQESYAVQLDSIVQESTGLFPVVSSISWSLLMSGAEYTVDLSGIPGRPKAASFCLYCSQLVDTCCFWRTPKGCVIAGLFCLFSIWLYTSKMFDLLGNRIIAYTDDSSLLAVFATDRPVVAPCPNRDLIGNH